LRPFPRSSIYALSASMGMGRQAFAPVSALRNGIVRRKVVSGIVNMRGGRLVWRTGLARLAHACAVARSSWVWFARMGMSRSSALKLAGSCIRVTSVEPSAERSDVWCLTVEDPEHWWSLSNGAVTHNSHGADAFRTAAVGLPMISGMSRPGRLRRMIRGLV
jgi:NAD(P)-dependent dehydrogenase (short-subunit alcohol dehydrogenase family)